jgi:membrane-associated phospholipid phosphatase
VIAAAVSLRRPRHVLGAALGVVLAAYLAGAALEVVKLFIERARPEEVLGAQIELSHGRSWAHLASFPSGHLIVTSAMAAAAASAVPALRRPLLVYVALVALTRVMFGAHFPIDVLVGGVVGYEIGVFTAHLLASGRLLPAPRVGAASSRVAMPSTARP